MTESTAPQNPAGAGRPGEASDLRELQHIELGILLDVKRVCEALGIEFFLGEGTLLGAVRHQGFIPWDDDIDLLMRRSEYERFLRLAPPLLAPKYAVQHASTVKGYWSPVIKVRLVEGEQKYRQTHIAHLTRDNGPLLDIFPLEYLPKAGGVALRLQSTAIRALRGLLVHKLRTKPADNWQRKLMRAIGRVLPTGLLHGQLHWAHTLHGSGERPYLGSLATYHPIANQVVPTSAFARAVPLGFEGHAMPVPVGFDRVLTTTYGDYHQVPPPEARGIQHEFSRIPATDEA